MLLAEMACDLDQVRIGQRFRFQQDGNRNRRVLLAGEAADSRLRRGSDIGERGTELRKLPGLDALHQVHEHVVENADLTGAETGRGRKKKLGHALQYSRAALGRGFACGRFKLR